MACWLWDSHTVHHHDDDDNNYDDNALSQIFNELNSVLLLKAPQQQQKQEHLHKDHNKKDTF